MFLRNAPDMKKYIGTSMPKPMLSWSDLLLQEKKKKICNHLNFRVPYSSEDLTQDLLFGRMWATKVW